MLSSETMSRQETHEFALDIQEFFEVGKLNFVEPTWQSVYVYK